MSSVNYSSWIREFFVADKKIGGIMFKYFCFFICCVCFTTSAFCEDLPIKLRQDSDKFTVINSSECIIYKLKVWSIPPEKEGVSNFFSRVGAELVGVGSFSALLGKIEK